MFLDKDEILVCRTCGIPLIWTFHFPYAEYFCINCGGHEGMMGAGKKVKITPELKLQSKKLSKLWGVLGGYLSPVSKFTKRNCKKCEKSDDHREHMTKKEIREDKVANKILDNLYGCFETHDYEDLRFNQ